jgi:hypothetical protein
VRELRCATEATIGPLLLAVLLASLGLVALLSRSDALARTTDGLQLALFERGQQIFLNRGNFLEFEDRLILEELPATDHSRGGVFFLGSSNLKWGLKLWALPDAKRRRLHNYGIGATNHTAELHFVRYLFEHAGLDRAPPDEVRLVLGLSCDNARMKRSRYFEALWARYGLFRYDPAAGISRIERNRLSRALATEKARLVSFLGGTMNQGARLLAAYFRLPLAPGAGQLTPEVIERMAANYDVPDPAGQIERQLQDLTALLAYLSERQVSARLVLLPERSSLREKPLPRAYGDAIQRIAREQGAPLTDLRGLLRDDEFLDFSHANRAGLDRIHSALMAVATSSTETP